MAKYIVEIPDGYTYCDRCPFFADRKGMKEICDSNDGLQIFNCEMQDLSKMTFLKKIDDDIEDAIIEFACDWIRIHANVTFDGERDDDGNPSALDYINCAKQRLEFAEKLCDDLRHYINQRKNESPCTDIK